MLLQVSYYRGEQMKKISLTKLSNLVKTNRDKLNITQKTLCDLTGINRAMISKIETGDYTPSIEQIEAIKRLKQNHKFENLSEILTCIFKFKHNKKTFDCGGKKIINI